MSRTEWLWIRPSTSRHGPDIVSGMPGWLADLPEQVTFDLSEVAQILFAIDLAVESATPGTPERRAARKAQVLVTARLWPELGELLENGDDEDH